jgi:thiol-disulfide isomerase/thioredoxin
MSSWLQRPNLVLLVIAAFALAAVAGNYVYRLQLQHQKQEESDPSPLASAVIGQYRPDFSFPDALGLSHETREWDGRVLVVNFWATWCKPCVREMPSLVDLQKQYAEHGVQFIGVALDTAPEVDDFFMTLGLALNYPSLIGGTDAIAVAEAYGNSIGILPYTVMVDRSGKIAYAQFGELTRDSAEQMILNLL